MTVDQVLVRQYRPSDRDAVLLLAPRLQIGVASWRDPTAVGSAVAGWIEESLDHSADADRAVQVAVASDEIVGVVTTGQRQHFTGEVDAYVGELVVKAGSERRGIGTLLLRAAEQWALGRGLRRLTLETGAANSSARAFYSRGGYQEEDVRLTKAL
ncbi:GNAT family N-acetyltransferase [Cryptosporangium phraense]|uniref:GNAT family N-acetyltransferase n=1 Tax=Cryptosporangium phraense TaxID=2593070 RepID=A0A545AX43_9ACTN|nr:GNAT family N-acetyltransferase [Cryptosporangium phraense]TQS45899.1 GNAT family N-acetyltransferase [Cryptosporangium phraense]